MFKVNLYAKFSKLINHLYKKRKVDTMETTPRTALKNKVSQTKRNQSSKSLVVEFDLKSMHLTFKRARRGLVHPLPLWRIVF